jgi:hypothetical protein
MSRSQRFALVGIAVAIAVVALVIVGPGGDDNGKSKTRPAVRRPGEAKPSGTRIEIRRGKPVGGIHRITVTKGEIVRLTVSSSDTASEVHVHGYDFMKDMKPRRPASFSFQADIEGVFEVELEDTKTQIAKLEVKPS